MDKAELEKQKDFIEDMESLIKDYGYNKEFAAALLSSYKITVEVRGRNGEPICGLTPEDFIPKVTVTGEIGNGYYATDLQFI